MLQNTTQDGSKNASVMENHIFKKSKSKDEYLGLVAKLFMHFKDMSSKWSSLHRKMSQSCKGGRGRDAEKKANTMNLYATLILEPGGIRNPELKKNWLS